jgi:hypothetical protein
MACCTSDSMSAERKFDKRIRKKSVPFPIWKYRQNKRHGRSRALQEIRVDPRESAAMKF